MKGTNKITKLLDNSPESLYWMGFIMADGYIEEKRISITLSDVDIIHLRKLKTFLGTTNTVYHRRKYQENAKGKTCSLVLCDSETVPKLKEQYAVGSRKTYNPPTLPAMTDDQFLSFLCGYIDGDGCISKQSDGIYTKKDGTISKYKRNDFLLQVKCHSSWIYLITNFGQRLCKIFDKNENLSKTRDRFERLPSLENLQCSFNQGIKRKSHKIEVTVDAEKVG
jgi:hypothetical protein